jgi:hypothetical protein
MAGKQVRRAMTFFIINYYCYVDPKRFKILLVAVNVGFSAAQMYCLNVLFSETIPEKKGFSQPLFAGVFIFISQNWLAIIISGSKIQKTVHDKCKGFYF